VIFIGAQTKDLRHEPAAPTSARAWAQLKSSTVIAADGFSSSAHPSCINE